MDNTGGSPPHKGSRWIADRILAAFEATTRAPAPEGTRLARPEIDDLVSRMLEEELERLPEKPSPPAPLPRAGEG